MHNIDLIITLTGSLAAAMVLGYITQRLGLSPIVGYLLAGIAIGPHTPGFVANQAMAEQMAEVGVILLMFGVGLHFQLKELLDVRRIAVPGAVGQSLAATLLGTLAALGFGWGWTAGIVYGLALSVASTVVLTRILSDNNELHTRVGHIAVGWLVVEDLFTVLVLVLMPAIFGNHGTGLARLPLVLGLAALKIGVLVAFTFLVGGRLIPWILERVVATRSRELFTLAILVMVLGIAVGSAKLFGASMALGAFLAGMVVGRSEFSLRAVAEVLPMRDAFTVLFFVSVGMLFNPGYLLDSPGIVVATLAIVVLGKPLAALAIVLAMRYPVRVAVAVAIALAQIGEFSFILAALGKGLGVFTDQAMNALVAAAIISISVNPLLYRLLDPLEAWAVRRSPLWRWFNFRAYALPGMSGDDRHAEVDPQHRAVIVGYGPVGQTLTRLLSENGIIPTVIELNLDTVHRLRKEGISAVYGDVSHIETLKNAGVDRAMRIILSASEIRNSREIIRQVREINPKIRVLARCAYLREVSDLLDAGANQVFTSEAEIAWAMTESILRELGAAPEQIDQEQDRHRKGLQG